MAASAHPHWQWGTVPCGSSNVVSAAESSSDIPLSIWHSCSAVWLGHGRSSTGQSLCSCPSMGRPQMHSQSSLHCQSCPAISQKCLCIAAPAAPPPPEAVHCPPWHTPVRPAHTTPPTAPLAPSPPKIKSVASSSCSAQTRSPSPRSAVSFSVCPPPPTLSSTPVDIRELIQSLPKTYPSGYDDRFRYPLITASGCSLAIFRPIPSLWTTSTTRATSL